MIANGSKQGNIEIAIADIQYIQLNFIKVRDNSRVLCNSLLYVNPQCSTIKSERTRNKTDTNWDDCVDGQCFE